MGKYLTIKFAAAIAGVSSQAEPPRIRIFDVQKEKHTTQLATVNKPTLDFNIGVYDTFLFNRSVWRHAAGIHMFLFVKVSL